VQPELRDFAQIQYRVIDMEQASMKLGLKPAPLDSTAEEVMIHLFLLRPAANHFASPDLRRYSTLRRVRIGLTQASVVALVAGVAWAGYNFARVFQGNEADDQVARQLAELNREYDEINRTTPSFGVGGSTMRDAVTFYNGAIRSFPAMPEFLRPVSLVLLAHPDVRLSQVSWQATDDARATPALGIASARGNPPVKAVGKSAESPPPASAEAATNPPFAGGRYEVALLEATVRVGNNDFRAALERVEKLAEAIGAIPGFRAEVAESPLDTRSSLQLQGRHGEREPATMEPRFVLRVMRDRGGAA
jgi:hypothetical protein